MRNWITDLLQHWLDVIVLFVILLYMKTQLEKY